MLIPSMNQLRQSQAAEIWLSVVPNDAAIHTSGPGESAGKVQLGSTSQKWTIEDIGFH